MSYQQQLTTKKEIKSILAVNSKTLAFYCNIKYYKELKEIGYERNQKKLTPKQVQFLKDKLGF